MVPTLYNGCQTVGYVGCYYYGKLTLNQCWFTVDGWVMTLWQRCNLVGKVTVGLWHCDNIVFGLDIWWLRACFATTKKCSDVGYVTPKVTIGLFDSFVTPILNYAWELWSKLEEHCTVERTHLKFLKYVLGVQKSTCSLAVYGNWDIFHCILVKWLKFVSSGPDWKPWPLVILLNKYMRCLTHLIDVVWILGSKVFEAC